MIDVQSCCVLNLNLLLSCRSRVCRRRRYLSSLMYIDYLSAGRRKSGCCQERLKLVETRLRIASTHVVGSCANLLEQKTVFI